MSFPMMHRDAPSRVAFQHLLTVAAVALVLLPRTAGAVDPALGCELAAEKSLQSCIKTLTKLSSKCYAATGADCVEGHAGVAKALSKLDALVAKKCGDDATVQAAGYGAARTLAGLSTRLRGACVAEAASIGARSFGGPQGAALAAADTDEKRACMNESHKRGAKLLVAAAKLDGKCVAATRKGKTCDTAKTAAKLASTEAKTRAKIEAACIDAAALDKLVAVTPEQFTARALGQAECVVAYGHPDVTPLSLACGPRASVPPLPRGVYSQVTLDEGEFGTRCGDGSPLSFWIRPAPDGFPIENVVFAMQGGGVCIFESDCNSASAGLFESASDNPPTQGIMSNDPLVSPFANYTKVFLPYCTQDVFIGGGTTSVWPSVTVHRFGAINTRATLRYVRDLVWAELDANDAEGYSPRRMRVMFGGFSAGAFGTLYNYHYVLDDLQWDRTTAFPDAALALDNGQAIGVGNLALIIIPDNPPIGWGVKQYLPPYCFGFDCAVGPIVLEATSPRLKEVPEQQFTILSNQVDNTQVSTTFFSDVPTWVNAMRQSYCDTAGLDGVRYFLPPVSSSIHVISDNTTRFTTLAVDGETMQDWFSGLLADPDGVVDRVQEGALTVDIPGVDPFPCSVAP